MHLDSAVRPFVSVIIPVRDDTERLRLCLQALEDQTYPDDAYEVIVVDNGSKDDLTPVVAAYTHARLTQEARRGAYAARNTGVRLARGAILAFTDSDCIPTATWVDHGVRALAATPNCGLVAGQVSLFFADAQRLTSVEIYESVMAFPQQRYVEQERFGVTANVFTWRAVFDNVGLFDSRLQSGGDRDWGQRVDAAGYRLLYAPDVVVRHPARRTLPDLIEKTRRTLRGQLAQAAPPTSVRLTAGLREFVPNFRFLNQVCAGNTLPGLWGKAQFITIYLIVRAVRGWSTLSMRCAYRHLSEASPLNEVS